MPKAKTGIKERTKLRAFKSTEWIELDAKIKYDESTPELQCALKSALADNQSAFLALRLVHFPERYTV